MPTVYVDTKGVGQGSPAADYASLSAAISGESGTTGDLTIICRATDGDADTAGNVSITGMSADSITIDATGDQHPGTSLRGTGYGIVYSGSGNRVLRIYEDYVTLNGLYLEHTNTSFGTICIQIEVLTVTNNAIIIDKCVLRVDDTPSSDIFNDPLSDNNCNLTVKNSIWEGFSDDGIHVNSNWGIVKLINNTIKGGAAADKGLRLRSTADSSSKVKNNLIFNCATDLNDVSFAGTLDNNATEDATGEFGSLTISNELESETNDFHLLSTSSIIGDGTGPSSDSDVPTDDIDGDARSGTTCDIGADEYAAGGTTLTVSNITCTTHLDSISLSQLHNLSISDVLATTHIDPPTISVFEVYSLSVDGITGTTHIEDVGLSQNYNLSVSGVLSTTHIDTFALTQEYVLFGPDITATTHISEITLTVFASDVLSVDGITITPHIDSFGLLQSHALSVSDVVATTHISEITLTVVSPGVVTLTVAGITATTHIDDISLSQLHTLSISGITQQNYIDAISLSQLHVLAVDGITISTHIEAPTINYGITVTPSGITVVTTIDAISLIQTYYLDIYGIAQANYIESPTLTYSGTVLLGEVVKPYLTTATAARTLTTTTTARQIKAA